MKKQRIPRKLKRLLAKIVFGVITVALGLACALLNAYDTLLLTVVFLCLSFFLQIILHEGGHLIGGLISGYGFDSFRIGGVLLAKINGKLCLRWMPIAGTGGQCLMSPPDCAPEEAPYFIYHASGSAMNILSALLHIPLLFTPGAVRIFAVCMIAVGLYLGILNGFPLRIQGIDNDGMNLKRMKNDPGLRTAVFRQLQINAAHSAGVRLKDMPEDWFETPEHIPMHTALQFCRYLDQGAYDTALAYGQKVMHNLKLNRIHRGSIMSDVETLKLLKGLPVFAESEFLKKYRKMMAYDPAVQRARFVRALLKDRDEAAAEKIYTQFERALRRSPTPAGNACEIALVAAAREKYDELTQTEGA